MTVQSFPASPCQISDIDAFWTELADARWEICLQKTSGIENKRRPTLGKGVIGV